MKIKNIFVSLFLVLLISSPAFSQGASDLFDQGNEMLTTGNFEKAAGYYKSAISAKPKYPEAYLGLGMCYKELGKYDEAYTATMTAIRLKPDYYHAYYNLGLILEKQGRYDEAINAYEKFLDKVPGAENFTDAKQRIITIKRMRG